MIILGWHGGTRRLYEDTPLGWSTQWSTHDSAAIALRDGALVAAIEEERLDRVKHSNFFPSLAIERCLSLAGISLQHVDQIAMNFAEMPHEVFPRDFGRPSRNMFLDDPTLLQQSVRSYINRRFQEEFGQDVTDRLFFCEHHTAHLWSAVHFSGFRECLAISFDGSGDGIAGCIALATASGLQVLYRIPEEHSLGTLYHDLIRILGFKRFDEYKVMGLAPYGTPQVFDRLFSKMYNLLPNGTYQLIDRHARWDILSEAGLVDTARRAGAPFTQAHMDFAASLQAAIESIILHVIAYYKKTTGMTNLALAGGVGHNCSANGRILYEAGFRRFFVQPASHDAGGAIGAAIAAHRAASGPLAPKRLTHLYLGTDLPPDPADISALLDSWRPLITFERADNPARDAAKLIADGAVIAWVQGRSEFGPRALGNRSILADPRPSKNKERINSMIKKREAYRPFAPAVLEERIHDYFQLPSSIDAPYEFMILVVKVLPSAAKLLGATTHVDGTARVQSVSRSTNPIFWELIHEFEKLSGVPVVLNTSFNNHAEPIVDSVYDAVVSFLTTGLDYLFIGDHVVRKVLGSEPAEAIPDLMISLSPNRKLVRRSLSRTGNSFTYAIESTSTHHFARPTFPVSRGLFNMLLNADQDQPIASMLDSNHFDIPTKQAIVNEIIALWNERAVVLSPKHL